MPAGLLAAIFIAANAIVVFLVLRARRDPRPAAAVAAVDAPAVDEPRHSPSLGWPEGVAPMTLPNGGGRSDGAAQPLAPPDTATEWRAEIRWQAAGSSASFHVIARDESGVEATVSESPALAWPPSDPDAVQALTDTVEQLEASLLRAGWERLEPGEAWYAKRFAWRIADRLERQRRFMPRLVGPESEALFRCEIEWQAGYINSRFKAVVHAPGERRGRTVASSGAFKWMLLGDPDVNGAAFGAEVSRLADALEAAGWKRAGQGEHWYSGQYVWEGDGTPPDQLELVRTEAGEVS